MSSDKIESVLQLPDDPERDRMIYSSGFIPGWIGEGGLQPEPTNDYFGAKWSWKNARELLLLASKSVDPKVAERRNIRMANPSEGKRTSLNNLHASYQMVGPKEFARAHRHTVNAGRFILESDTAFTTLNGEKVLMEPNDIILTPNWIWHGLGNESEIHGAFWIDFLDDPIVAHLKTIFFEVRDENYELMEFNEKSPYHIKWSEVNKKLDSTSPGKSEHYGVRVKLDTPSIPTMEIYVERFPGKVKTRPIKSTIGHLFICVEGCGYTDIDGDQFSWERGDVVAAPSWKNYHHNTSTQAILVDITDEPIIEAMGWYREYQK